MEGITHRLIWQSLTISSMQSWRRIFSVSSQPRGLVSRGGFEQEVAMFGLKKHLWRFKYLLFRDWKWQNWHSLGTPELSVGGVSTKRLEGPDWGRNKELLTDSWSGERKENYGNGWGERVLSLFSMNRWESRSCLILVTTVLYLLLQSGNLHCNLSSPKCSWEGTS